MNRQRIVVAAALVMCVAGAARAAGRSDVADAVMKGDKAALRTLLQQKADVNAAQIDGATALHWAVYRNDLEAADLLIRAGVNVDTANREGVTPLAMASGVTPSRLAVSTLTPARISRSAASRSLRYTAQCSAVAPSICAAFTSAFCCSSVLNAALSPFITASATSLRPAARAAPATHITSAAATTIRCRIIVRVSPCSHGTG